MKQKETIVCRHQDCSNTFIKFRMRAFCSDSCAKDYVKVKYSHTCEVCNKEFRSGEKNAKYCSPSCRYVNCSTRNKVKCPVCKEDFYPKGKTQKHCSYECANEALRVHKKYDCEYCGVSFESTDGSARRFCSVEHFRLYTKEQANNNRKYLTCEVCGESFTERYGDSTNQFCSLKCAGVGSRTLSDVRCETCGTYFHPDKAGRRFCSYSCFAESVKASPKECENCGSSFIPRGSAIKYCSRDCVHEARKVEKEEKSCDSCGISFVPKHRDKNQRFCSHDCSVVGITKERRLRSFLLFLNNSDSIQLTQHTIKGKHTWK